MPTGDQNPVAHRPGAAGDPQTRQQPGAAASRLGAMSTADRLGAYERGSQALANGGLVVAGCESGALAIARADQAAGIEGLRAIWRGVRTGELAGIGPAWLARGTRPALEALTEAGVRDTHRRLIERLAPGPIGFLAEMSESGLDSARLRIRVGPESIDDGRRLGVRIPGRSPAQTLVQQTTGPLACVEIPDTQGRSIASVGEGAARVAEMGLEIGAALDDGPPEFRQGATIVLLPMDASPATVVREGAYEARFIAKQTTVSVLFICTGNTCRSPMAEAIASGIASRSPGGVGVPGGAFRFGSAGVGAGNGSPATPEAANAVRELGFAIGPHRSRTLTRALIENADVVYAMTRSHLEAARAMGAGDKVRMLDTEDGDVPDPVGSPQSVYNQTARRLADLITRRLKELGA